MKGSDIKMNDLNILINEIISENQEINEEILLNISLLMN